MNTPSDAPSIGLCATCVHARIIENRRGSRFYLCERSHTDPAFARYPRLPVRQCRGYERGHEAGTRPAAGTPGDATSGSEDEPRG